MSFRPYFWGSIVLTAIFFSGETFVPAQTITDLTLWKESQNAEAVPRWANDVLTRGFRNVTGTAREELLAKTLSALAEIVADSDVVPSTRFNAILTIGQLEASPGTPPALPTAYPAALTYLIDLYQQADVPYYLKHGVLRGLERHAILGIDPDQRDKVIDLFLETVTSEFVPEHEAPLEPAVEDWFRQTALDGLAALKTTGTHGKVVSELLCVLNDKAQELEEWSDSQEGLTREMWVQTRRVLELASKVAKTLGDLDYSSATNMDAEKMADAFMRLTQAVCDIEYKIVADFIDRETTSPDPAKLREQIVVGMKMYTQSVVWGIQSEVLARRPSENSFYASLKNNDPAIKLLDILKAEINELSTFFDEGARTRRGAVIPPMPGEFKFDLLELRDALKKCSETLAKNHGHL
jgi:hypothetical protein